MTFHPERVLITGANGQLGRELQRQLPEAIAHDRMTLNIADQQEVQQFNWSGIDTIINTAAWTAVDDAEKAENHEKVRQVNVDAVRYLTDVAMRHDITLVHVSSDYVFDGTREIHTEDEPMTPRGVYAETKAAGDVEAAKAPKHYIARTSWVVGDGNNFVRTMVNLAGRDVTPSVVNDQFGRLTFTEDLAAGIRHLLETGAPYGTYNLSNEGRAVSWADIAKRVYELSGKSADMVTPTSTEAYFGDKPHAPRPTHSTLDLAKIESTGFTPRDQFKALKQYMDEQLISQQKEAA